MIGILIRLLYNDVHNIFNVSSAQIAVGTIHHFTLLTWSFQNLFHFPVVVYHIYFIIFSCVFQSSGCACQMNFKLSRLIFLWTWKNGNKPQATHILRLYSNEGDGNIVNPRSFLENPNFDTFHHFVWILILINNNFSFKHQSSTSMFWDVDPEREVQ